MIIVKCWLSFWFGCFTVVGPESPDCCASVCSLSASDVMSLDGSSSSLVYRLSPGPRRTSRDVVSLRFKTLRNSGTLLHAEGEGGLGLSLELERGKLQLLLRQGRLHIYYIRV